MDKMTDSRAAEAQAQGGGEVVAPMTADVELLPLPEDYDQNPAGNAEIQDYARTNVAHATAARDAEIEALRAELAKSKHSYECAARALFTEAARAERLAEALRFACTRFAPYMDDTDRAAFDAALHPTAAQENDDA